MSEVLMGRRRRSVMLTWMAVMFALVAGLVFGLVRAPGAGATFPGRSGLIEFLNVRPFDALHGAYGPPGRITTIDPNGSGARKLASGFDPTFSADGTKIAFDRFTVKGGVQTENVRVMNADGSGLHQLTHCLGDCNYPVFTPTGSILYLDHTCAQSHAIRCVQLWSVDADGQNAKLLMQRTGRIGKARNSPLFISSLALSPDGTTLAYLQGLAGAIYTMALDGSSVHRLTAGSHPDYSPDGQHIVFERLVGGGLTRRNEIWVMNADGSGKRRLFQNEVSFPWFGASPHFSPDGSSIVFLRRVVRKGITNVYVIRLDGSGLRQVTHEPRGVYLSQPTWQPKP